MVYKFKKTDAWVRVPVNRAELDFLKVLLKQEKKTLKNFIDESIKKKLTGKTLLV